ncbi:uncharacterized protein SPAPADRAFT_48888 [Spathaspora passalidarum NRRL Y-27907]|uniref:Uncharacterized protein n=1 Tax=Spathaspora passalidarum (strain NRRL Y-27907 / 11-Y1) TaxID=619300 RepID=G3AIW0_SPAPN|nr:uncharacterized protein SPAPADRAFT_48888 [Spathaspora passalidarum NRRL Y-27907]EGW33771.1 hypothetical protein SPAPADRAFT_48888 [Spathaspora passalidarum NRRL Y-27907]
MTDIASQTFGPCYLDRQSSRDEDTTPENSPTTINDVPSVSSEPPNRLYSSSEVSLPSLINKSSSYHYSPAPSLSSSTPSSIGQQIPNTSLATLQPQSQLQSRQQYQQYFPAKSLIDGYPHVSSTLSEYSLESRSYQSSTTSSLPPIAIGPPPPITHNYSQPFPRPATQPVAQYSQPVRQLPEPRQYPIVMATGIPSFTNIQHNNVQTPNNQPTYVNSGYEYRTQYVPIPSIPQLNSTPPSQTQLPGSPIGTLAPVDTRHIYYSNFSSGINRYNTLQSRIKAKAPVTKRKTKQLTTWTQSEDELLRGLKEVQKLGWREISTFFHERTPNACEFRWRRIIRSLNTTTNAVGKTSPKTRKSPMLIKSSKNQMTAVTNIDYLLN